MKSNKRFQTGFIVSTNTSSPKVKRAVWPMGKQKSIREDKSWDVKEWAAVNTSKLEREEKSNNTNRL